MTAVAASEMRQPAPADPGAPELVNHLVEVSASPASATTVTAVQKTGSTTPKVVFSDRNQSFVVAQKTFRLLTHWQSIEGTTEETVEWWELRDAQGRVIHREVYPVEFQNGMFESTVSIAAQQFKTGQGGGILIHGYDLPSAPNSGGWVQVFGYKYGRDKYGADDSLFGPFGPPISIYGEFLEVGTDSSSPTPTTAGGVTVTVMHDVLKFRLWTGNFNIVYPVLINWITGTLQPAARCTESTSRGRVERCSYPINVEDAHRENQATFVRLFPEADDGFTPKHVIVQPQSKVEFLEARMPVSWNQDDKSISFGVNGDTWLKVRIDGVEGWIHSEEDFDAVGLPQAG